MPSTDHHRLWIKNPLAAYAPAQDLGGGVVVSAGEIVESVPTGSVPKTAVTSVFDASQHVLLPGLINTHHHFYQTLTRAVPAAADKPLFAWLKSLYPIWANLQPEMLIDATELALVELMYSGCTTAVDHHYLFPPMLGNAIDLQAEVAHRLGVRVVLTRGSMSLSEQDGGLPPVQVVQAETEILRDSERVLQRYHRPTPGAMLQIALAPCSPFSVSESLMRASAQLARAYGARLHTHLAETRAETDYCLAQFGRRPLDYLEAVGWLGDDVWLAHGIHFNADERKQLGAAGVGISHCPSSNMLLGSGICPAVELEVHGCAVGLAVDGAASNDGSNLIQECRQALLLQRLDQGAEKVSVADVLRWATEGSARCLGRADLGGLQVGKRADLALFKLDEVSMSGAHDPLAALLLCGAQRVDALMIEGRWKVRDGRLLDVDIQALQARHQLSAQRLLAAC